MVVKASAQSSCSLPTQEAELFGNLVRGVGGGI